MKEVNKYGKTFFKRQTAKQLISAITAAATIFGTAIGTFAEIPDKYKESAIVTKYDSNTAFTQKKEQGYLNWYYCQFSTDTATELTWNAEKSRWIGTEENGWPILKAEDLMPGNANDVGYRFKAPDKGMVRLRGTVSMPYNTSATGDGVTAIIAKGSKVVLSEKVRGYNSITYDEVIPVREGEYIDFKINKNSSNTNKFTKWWPTVEYIDAEYVEEPEDYTYYQKDKDGKETQLIYDEAKEGYTASDNTAFINSRNVMPTKEYSLVRRYVVPEDGRYRVFGNLLSEDKKGSGIVLAVYKNKQEVWRQYFPAGEKQNIDVRMLSSKGDVIDVEAMIADYEGYNYSSWSFDVTKYVGTLFCSAATSVGQAYDTKSSFSLGSLIGTTKGANNTYIYSFKNDLTYDMDYNTATKRWESTVVTSGGLVPADGGYVSATNAVPGNGSDTIIETTLTQDGILRLDGNMLVNDSGDGVLGKVYLNDELLWSSRVGGERAVRWDEPFDVSYFLNKINVVANVKNGDKLKFTFNKWIKTSGDLVDLNSIILSYIDTKDTKSKTTNWKLKNSTIIDTVTCKVKVNGTEVSADVKYDGDTTYIAKENILNILGSGAKYSGETKNIDGKEYVAIRKATEQNNKSVAWVADRYAIVYAGIPVLFGYPELSEIKTFTENGGVL